MMTTDEAKQSMTRGRLLPIAILGSEDFQVSDVDPASVRLEGVAALRSNLEDVAARVEGQATCDCTEDGPDGLTDMTLKFETQAVLEALGAVEDGEEFELTLAGLTWDNDPIEGSDCVLILRKDNNGKKPKE